MTAKEAKSLFVKVWSYLAQHPWLDKKDKLPENLHLKTENLLFECPLCKYFAQICEYCPLVSCTNTKEGLFFKWSTSETDGKRCRYARQIVRRIQRWKV